jgi:hypothetical protein
VHLLLLQLSFNFVSLVVRAAGQRLTNCSVVCGVLVIIGAERLLNRFQDPLIISPPYTAGTVVEEFEHFQEFRCLVIVWLVLAPVTDMVISGSLVAFLRSNRTGFAATDDILSKLTRCMP